MSTTAEKATRHTRWGKCPVCFKERKYTANGKLVFHRQWIPGFLANGNPNHPDSHPYGYMKPCLGSGQLPLPL